MPRQVRLDAPGVLQRLSAILADTGTLCRAWTLIPNHFLVDEVDKLMSAPLCPQ